VKPGERIRLITQAAESLAARPWPEVQLTLDQFGLDTYEPDGRYGPEPLEYCMSQMKGAQDDTLTSLHDFLLGGDAAPVGARVGDGIWTDLPVRAFLSHIHQERHLVGQVKRWLAELYGITSFVAHDDIHPSKQWREAIKEGLGSCHVFVAFLHDGYHESQWCDQEAGWALARGIPILPVRPSGFDRSKARDGFLEEHQDISLDRAGGSVEYWAADQIFQSVLRHSQTREVGVKALAEAFVSSRSFDSTRRFWAMIEAQPVIESEQLRRLEYAVQVNRQVYEAVAGPSGTPVPDLVKALVDKFEPPAARDPWDDTPPF
jgi:hypothetical protein